MKVERFGTDKRVVAVKFTDQVDTYMAACDVLLTKPGGISSTEAAVKNVPIIHVMQFPGNETENARFFSQRGMSVLAANFDDAVTSAIRFVLDKDAAMRMKEAQRQYINRNAAEDICNTICYGYLMLTQFPKQDL